MNLKTTLFFSFLFLSAITSYSQKITIGFTDSIQSEVLNENRKFMIKLPNGYYNSDKSYPVLYRLDGSLDLFTETAGTLNRLTYMEELVPEMIVVMIENTNRNRDMMPTNTNFFNAKPGANNFINFIENELISHINNSYRCTNEKLLCGQSLSAVFTLYYFLTNTNTFNSYLAFSGGFPGCEEYFNTLTNEFSTKKLNTTCTLFLTYGLNDFLDPKGIINKQLIGFSEKIEEIENVKSHLKIYTDEGHVPFQSLYHALKFVYSAEK